MKKIISLLSLALLFAINAQAQTFRYGVTGAMNLSQYALKEGTLSLSSDNRVGFRVGMRVEMDAKFVYEGFFLDSELLFSSRGAELSNVVEGSSISLTSRPYYLEMPIHMGYRYAMGKGNVSLFGSFGPYFAVGIFGSDKLDMAGVKSEPDSFSEEGLKRFDFGLGLRGGVEMFHHYRLFLGYDWGLINIAKSDDSPKINNRNFYIGMSYLF